MNIQKKVVVVTGGARGLGKAIAERLAQEGATLALVDLGQENLDNTVAELNKTGITAKGYIANVADEAQVISTMDKIEEELGPITGLVNNAGILRDGLMVKARDGEITSMMSLEDWQAVIDVNLTGVFLCGREAAARMIKSNTKGVIVNISSVVKDGNMGQSNYAAAKAGVASLTVTWARELARQGIRVAAVAPGVFETDMVMSMKEEARERIASNVPLKRLGQPAELANSIAWIIDNDYFTGRTLQLDGGIII